MNCEGLYGIKQRNKLTSLSLFAEQSALWVTKGTIGQNCVFIFFKTNIFTHFDNGLGYRGSIPCQVITKTQKRVLDATFLNTQNYKVRIKDKVENSREWSCTLYTWQLKRESSSHPRQRSLTFYAVLCPSSYF